MKTEARAFGVGFRRRASWGLTVSDRALILIALAVVAAVVGTGLWALFGPLGFTGFPLDQGTLIWAMVAGIAGSAGLAVALYLLIRDIGDRREVSRYEELMDEPFEITYLIPKEQYKKTGITGLAHQLLEDAKRDAERTLDNARREAEEQAATVLTEAQTRADEMVAEAEREAEESPGETLRQAQSQAQDTLTAAQQQAEETINEGHREAERLAEETLQQARAAARRESESILDSASRSARMTEAQAKEAAGHILARAREDVTGDAKGAYDKLLSTLQEILAAAQGIESSWGERPDELSDGTSLRLEEFAPALLESLRAGEAEAAAVASDGDGTDPPPPPGGTARRGHRSPRVHVRRRGGRRSGRRGRRPG